MNSSIQTEAADAVLDLKVVYAEVYPHRNPDAMRVDDAQIAMVVLFRRELTLLEKRMKWRAAPNTEA